VEQAAQPGHRVGERVPEPDSRVRHGAAEALPHRHALDVLRRLGKAHADQARLRVTEGAAVELAGDQQRVVAAGAPVVGPERDPRIAEADPRTGHQLGMHADEPAVAVDLGLIRASPCVVLEVRAVERVGEIAAAAPK
jgi:hypothetical protein